MNNPTQVYPSTLSICEGSQEINLINLLEGADSEGIWNSPFIVGNVLFTDGLSGRKLWLYLFP